LLEIASMNPEHKNTDTNASSEEMNDVDDWSCTQSTWDDMAPTDDWSDYVKDLAKRGPNDGDHSLEAMLDGFGDEGMRDTFWPAEAFEARRQDLAKLAFHWTNVERFAGIKREDVTPTQQPFCEDLSHLTHARKFRW
jgi:hypothetical protein